jgi:hypothetical protein
MKTFMMMAAVSMVLAGSAMASSVTHLANCSLANRGGSYNLNVVVNEVSGPAGTHESSTTAVITETSEEGQMSEIGAYEVEMTENGATDGPVVYSGHGFRLELTRDSRASLQATVDHGRKISQEEMVCVQF